MAGRPALPDTFPGADRAQSQDTSRPGGRPQARGKNVVIERWLQLHLRQLYQEVCNEPLPSELNEMIDRLRWRRKDGEPGQDSVVPLPPAARQGS